MTTELKAFDLINLAFVPLSDEGGNDGDGFEAELEEKGEEDEDEELGDEGVLPKEDDEDDEGETAE